MYEIVWTAGAEAWLGESVCASMPTALLDGELLVDVRARDAAGNWSDWSDPRVIAFERPGTDEPADEEIRCDKGDRPRGCTTGGALPTGGAAALALALVAVRTRKRSPTRRG